jgi:hypothetical protein
VQLHGPGAKRNFPDEVISELPVALGEERKQRSSSRYVGVSWHKASSRWKVHMKDPQTKRKHRTVVRVAIPSSGFSVRELADALMRWHGVRYLTLLGVSSAATLAPLATA